MTDECFFTDCLHGLSSVLHGKQGAASDVTCYALLAIVSQPVVQF